MTAFTAAQRRQGLAARPAAGGLQSFYNAVPKHVWVPIILTYACLLPREMTVNLAGAALFPYRVGLFIFLPFALTQAVKHVRKFSILDFLAGFTAIWHVIALLVTESVSTAFVRGGSQGADFILAYLIGRATLRSADDFRSYFLAIIPGLAVTAAIMAVESLAGRLILRPFVAELFGQPRPTSVYERVRLGFFRASGPFPHPILGAVFLAAMLPFAWYIPKSAAIRTLAVVISLCCLFTVSSTAVLSLGLCIAIMVMYWIQRVSQLPVFVTAAVYFLLAYLAISAVSESGPISVISRYILLESGSSAYRQLIWQYAGAEAMNHPMFGIGFRDWVRLDWMIESIDSYWLSSAMRLGFPMAVGAFLTIAGTAFVLIRRCSRAPVAVQRTAFAICVSLSVIIFSGFTVHLWEGVACWMLMITGAGVTLSQWQYSYRPQPPVATARPMSRMAPRAGVMPPRALGPVNRTRSPQ